MVVIECGQQVHKTQPPVPSGSQGDADRGFGVEIDVAHVVSVEDDRHEPDAGCDLQRSEFLGNPLADSSPHSKMCGAVPRLSSNVSGVNKWTNGAALQRLSLTAAGARGRFAVS